MNTASTPHGAPPSKPSRPLRRSFRLLLLSTVPLIAGMFRRLSFLICDRKIVWRDLHASTAEQAADLLKALDCLKS